MKHKVFLIEDNPTEGFLLRLALSNIKNLVMTHFKTGSELMDKIIEKPSVAIVDLNLPDIYVKRLNGAIECVAEFDYDTFKSRV